MATTKIELVSTETGKARLLIDGHDFSSKVREVKIHVAAGELTTVTVTYAQCIVDVTSIADECVVFAPTVRRDQLLPEANAAPRP